MENKIDIFDILEEKSISKEKKYSFTYTPVNYNRLFKYKILIKHTPKYISHSFKYKIKKEIKAITLTIWILKYIATSSTIFAVLILTANYSAYINIAKSYIYADEMKVEASSLLNSVEASKITNSIQKERKIKHKINEEKIKSSNSRYSLKKLTQNSNTKKPALNIEITPYENRIILPKIGKNIPLIDIKQKSVSGQKELENIFMKELEDWVVRYPGSTKPGKNWNTFIFGHSSNYPWIKWDYNEVFANLNKLNYWDEVIIYYGQNKYIYKIKTKKVISPRDTKVLKRNNWKDELTLMTCWPVGTTLNRLLVIWELVKQ